MRAHDDKEEEILSESRLMPKLDMQFAPFRLSKSEHGTAVGEILFWAQRN